MQQKARILDLQAYLAEPELPPTHQADYLLQQGDLWLGLNNYQAALANYDQVVSLKPDDWQAWFNRGFALDELGRYEEAISSYDKALAINPDHQNAWYNRGITFGKLGRYKEAIASYDNALTINPNNQSVHAAELLFYSAPTALLRFCRAPDW